MKRGSSFTLHSVGDQHVLIPIGQRVNDLNGIITLNDTAFFIWTALEREISFEQIVDLLLKKYEIEPDLAYLALQSFIDKLNSYNLIEE